jgi:hypothetical protein
MTPWQFIIGAFRGIETAVANERERCCKDLCQWCRQVIPLPVLLGLFIPIRMGAVALGLVMPPPSARGSRD